MVFDTTITFGNLVTAIAILAGWIGAFYKLGGRLDVMNQRLTSVEEAVRNHRDTSERLAVIETRQATHGQMIVIAQQDIRDLKHGRGFIRDRADDGINGEYP